MTGNKKLHALWRVSGDDIRVSAFVCSFVVATAMRAIPHIVPITRPLAAPRERQTAGSAYFRWQVSLLTHAIMLPRTRVRHNRNPVTSRNHAYRFTDHLPRCRAVEVTSVAIVGAGLSGLVVARRLQSLADVTVFEKSRGVGGRMATRYAGEFEFDHGAQFFTARTDAFKAFLGPLIDGGVVADWKADFAELNRDVLTASRSWGDSYPHYVGTPRMSSIGKHLSANLNIALETDLCAVVQESDGWRLLDSAGTRHGPFDWLVVTAPAAQTAALAEDSTQLVAYCGERRMLGCFALMLGFAEGIDLPWNAALVRNADISWISVNSSKPGRGHASTMVVHSTNAWADAHMEDDGDAVLEHMLDEASAVSGADLRTAVHRQVHRWRYANIAKQSGPTHFVDDEKKLAACGDWWVRGRIEAAFTSANALAGSLVERI